MREAVTCLSQLKILPGGVDLTALAGCLPSSLWSLEIGRYPLPRFGEAVHTDPRILVEKRMAFARPARQRQKKTAVLSISELYSVMHVSSVVDSHCPSFCLTLYLLIFFGTRKVTFSLQSLYQPPLRASLSAPRGPLAPHDFSDCRRSQCRPLELSPGLLRQPTPIVDLFLYSRSSLFDVAVQNILLVATPQVSRHSCSKPCSTSSYVHSHSTSTHPISFLLLVHSYYVVLCSALIDEGHLGQGWQGRLVGALL